MESVHPKNQSDWIDWLRHNHLKSAGVWLKFPKKGSGERGITYDEAIDAALCYGWVDSVIMRVDDRTYARRFTPRRPTSIWSKLNIERVRRLAKEGRMAKHGMDLFQKRSGRFSQAEQFKVEEPPFPEEFMKALKKNTKALENFQKFSPSHRKRYLMWLTSAKRRETMDRRIREAVEMIAGNVKSLLK